MGHDKRKTYMLNLENAYATPVPEGEVLPIALWESRVDQDKKEQGVKSPDGKFHPFADGEHFTMIKEDGDRNPYILTKEGEEVPFEEWIAKTSDPERTKIIEGNTNEFSISHDAKLSSVQSILRTVTMAQKGSWPLEKGIVSNHIYTYLTRRYSVTEQQSILGRFSKEEYQNYEDRLESIGSTMKALGYQVVDGSSWFSIYADNEQAVPRKRFAAKGETIDVNYKEYFSVNPNEVFGEENVEYSVEDFLSSLPEIAEKLRIIGDEQDDKIKIKVPGSLANLLLHPDSVVAHYRKESTGALVRKAIEVTLTKKRVAFGRGGRVASGFDFSITKDGNTTSKSHSQLISDLAADLIVQDVNRNGSFAYPDPASMVQWLDNTLDRLGKQSPEDILKLVP